MTDRIQTILLYHTMVQQEKLWPNLWSLKFTSSYCAWAWSWGFSLFELLLSVRIYSEDPGNELMSVSSPSRSELHCGLRSPFHHYWALGGHPMWFPSDTPVSSSTLLFIARKTQLWIVVHTCTHTHTCHIYNPPHIHTNTHTPLENPMWLLVFEHEMSLICMCV